MSYAPQGSGPYPQNPAGPQPYGVAPQNPAALQAAWRYSARRKNDTTAWLLWIGGPFLIGLPVHDFYFGDIGRGLAKLGLIVLGFVGMVISFIVGAMSTAGTDNAMGMPAGILIGMGLLLLCFLILAAWWIYDGVTMTRRIESKNDRIRQQIAAEQGIDAWSF
ncbi:TM2 domain-containing protein [Kocuria coralli]|uniref:TM2 domain-containing protein n=1 Tax=Kocuria coralli TaxID=1461025 RepID=UPI0015F2B248|nr:TM2 domain-containing protein [Kocuria coralli]